MCLAAVEDNSGAQGVYQRVGFHHDGAAPDADGHLIMHDIPTTQEPSDAR
jgi:RimJ/RimL family protein N-acetyltransferase